MVTVKTAGDPGDRTSDVVPSMVRLAGRGSMPEIVGDVPDRPDMPTAEAGERSMAATVLVIEDELQLRDLVRAYLRREGIDVLSTGSGAEGLALAASGEPDLVILDLGLPDVPGEEVARELRRTGDVPILVLTAKVAEADRIHCSSSAPTTT